MGPTGGVERLGVHRGRAGQAFDLPLAQPHPGRPFDRRPGIGERPARRLHRRQPRQPRRVPARGQVQHRISRTQILHRRYRHRCFQRRSGRRGAGRAWRRSSWRGPPASVLAAVPPRTRAARPRRPDRPFRRRQRCRRQCGSVVSVGGSDAGHRPIGLAGHRDRPEHGGQPAPMPVLHPRPQHPIAPGHPAAAQLQPGTLIQMPLQQQPILLPRMDLQPCFQLTVPGSRRLRPVQPRHHRFQIPPGRAGPPRPTAGLLGAVTGLVGAVTGRAVGRADTAGTDRGR